MAEANAGAAGAGGDAGAAGGAGAGAAGAGGAGAATPPWHGLPDTDADGIAYVGNKGWKAPADIIKSYRGAEALIGRDPSTLLQIPRADDAEGQRALFQKLGLPETADKYDMNVGLPEGTKADDVFAKQMQGLFHKAGLTGGQAKALVGDWNALQIAARAQAETDYNLNVAADKQALADEWKGGFDRMVGKAKSTASALGYTPEVIDAMEKSMGYAKTYKFFAGLADKLGETGLVTSGKTAGFEGTMTPAEAKTQLDATRLDQNHMAAMLDGQHPGHKAAQEKENRLFKIMFPE